MNTIELLREELKWAHETQEGTIADLTEDSAHFNEINKAIPAGAAYAHSILGEDMVVSMMLANKPGLAIDKNEVGVSELMPPSSEFEKHEAWYKSVKVDLPKLREFAKKVYKATDDYLSTLSDEDLDKQLDLSGMGMGKQSVSYVICNFVILHIANLTGEISAAKGFQGLKGYPF